MKRSLLTLIGGVAITCLSSSAMAGLLDFTDAALIGSLTKISNGYSGTIDGIGFTLTSSDGSVNFKQNYDGSTSAGCQSSGGDLKCDKDGTGIGDDEIAGYGVGGQTLTLAFDRSVNLSGFHFLDLYVNPNGSGAKEQATISIDGVLSGTVDAIGSNGDGGYANLMMSPKLGQIVQFTAAADPIFWDDSNNDYALAGVNVSAVPLPATIWLFATALAGFGGIRRIVK